MKFLSRFPRLGRFSSRVRMRQRQMQSSYPTPSFRPRLEALEDRVVPASLSYDTLLNGTVLASAVDSSGNAYVTGTANSSSPGGTFVAKLNPTGTAVLYETYLGGNGGSGIAIDASGDAYVIGTGPNVQTTPNAIASAPSGSYSSGEDVFVTELDPTGSNILYSTYIPGAVSYPLEADYVGSIAVDSSGNIDVAGAAQAGLPVTANAFQTSYLSTAGAGSNAFFAKIDPALSGTQSVLYASYLGGSGYDMASSIALDNSGNAYLYGTTQSSNFPTTSGAFQRTLGGGQDAFVAKFNPALSGAASLAFSTYLGGSRGDGFENDDLNQSNQFSNTINPAGGIAVDSTGNVYVTGSTMSTNFPTTSGAYQTTSNMVSNKYNSLPTDVFVTKLNATGSALIYSTYLGGGSNPYGKGQKVGTFSGGSDIAVDASGDAYVTGWTNSTVFPTLNAIQSTNKAGKLSDGMEGANAFVTVLNPSGSGLLFSTYLGSSSQDWGFSIALDSANNAYVSGQNGGNGFGGGGFVAKIDPPVEDSTATPAIASTLSGAAASNGQPAPSPADQLFTLIGNNPGSSAIQTMLSSLLSEWQSLESTLLSRFDSLMNMVFNAGTQSGAPDNWLRDLPYVSLPSTNDV